MLFNSIYFLFFFPIVYLPYWFLWGGLRRNYLTFASILFYAVWGLEREGLVGLRWTGHFLLITILNYYAVEGMLVFPKRRKLFLNLAVLGNLANLIFFKYTGFFLRAIMDLGAPLQTNPDHWDLFLPLAISFYTFQLTAYVVDVYRGVIKERVDLSRFLLFILFFPQLIAGPIMRSTDFLEQIDNPTLSRQKMYDGLWLLIGGLVKKVVLADPMGILIAPVFRTPEAYSGWGILLAGFGFSLQVYGDFSGYTDMARGSAKLLGYDIPENFSAPFFARSAKELWARWHITLSSWLRDYIYFSLGGSRVGKVRTYVNLFITFTLGGLWHGADYTYLAWGAFWGFLLVLERYLETDLKWRLTPRSRVGVGLKVVFMFFLFALGAIMFRSQKVIVEDRIYPGSEIMGLMLSGIVTNTDTSFESGLRNQGVDTEEILSVFGPDTLELKSPAFLDSFAFMFLFMFLFHMIQYFPGLLQRFRKWDPVLLPLTAAFLGGWILPLNVTGAHQFIYFVF